MSSLEKKNLKCIKAQRDMLEYVPEGALRRYDLVKR